MKKTGLIAVAALLLLLSSCQTTKVPEREILPLDFSMDGGKTLDGYWSAYFDTEDTYYLDQIMAYADSEDEMILRLNEAYADQLIGDDWISYLDLTDTDGVLTSKYDMDFFTIFLLSYGDEDDVANMRALYSLFPQDVLVRNTVKSSAYWSLYSNAEQRNAVKTYILQRLSELSPKTVNIFNDVYDISNVVSCIKDIEKASRWNAEGYGAATTYHFFDDGTWTRGSWQKNVTSYGSEYYVDVIEAKGTYKGNPLADGVIELTVTHERYWQQMDREIEAVAESGKGSVTDADIFPLPELNPTYVETIEISNGLLK